MRKDTAFLGAVAGPLSELSNEKSSPTQRNWNTPVRRQCIEIALAFITISLLLFTEGASLAFGQAYSVLHSFSGTATDGVNPFSSLVMDGNGNVYGTTNYGGAFGYGIAFELVNSNGSYSEAVLHNFVLSDGIYPHGNLALDREGNLYGTGVQGGAYGYGTAFELVKSSGGYSLHVLYNFAGSDGAYPYAGLIIDLAGNLFGTTSTGGADGYGTAFELVNSNNSYTETVLHNFSNWNGDGANPVENLLMDSAGNLYGTTQGGGFGYGTAFELLKSGAGYSETILHEFVYLDGANPYTSLTLDSAGNLYGTALSGGTFGYGTVFELVKANNSYSPRVLYSFRGTNGDGMNPQGGVVIDSSGNLYGMTIAGGTFSGCFYGCGGTVFELVNSSGSYAETVLHSFSNLISDGATPYQALTIDSAGNLFGPTFYGGTDGNGTIFGLSTVTTPQQAIVNILGYVNSIYSQGLLNGGQENSLVKELNQSASLLSKGKSSGAIENLQSFISEVTDLLSSGTLSPSNAAVLASGATSAIGMISTPASPLTISDLSASTSTLSTSVTVTWTSSIPATSRLLYALSGSTTFTATPVDTTSILSHSVTLTALSSGTYNAYAISSAGDQLAESPVASFTISPPLSITNFSVNNVTQNTANITWQTNIPATTQVFYALYPETTYTAVPEDTSLVTSHSVMLTGLINNGFYSVYGISTGSNDSVQSPIVNFRTLR